MRFHLLNKSTQRFGTVHVRTLRTPRRKSQLGSFTRPPCQLRRGVTRPAPWHKHPQQEVGPRPAPSWLPWWDCLPPFFSPSHLSRGLCCVSPALCSLTILISLPPFSSCGGMPHSPPPRPPFPAPHFELTTSSSIPEPCQPCSLGQVSFISICTLGCFFFVHFFGVFQGPSRAKVDPAWRARAVQPEHTRLLSWLHVTAV